jgi:hypothetical protein
MEDVEELAASAANGDRWISDTPGRFIQKLSLRPTLGRKGSTVTDRGVLIHKIAGGALHPMD